MLFSSIVLCFLGTESEGSDFTWLEYKLKPFWITNQMEFFARLTISLGRCYSISKLDREEICLKKLGF